MRNVRTSPGGNDCKIILAEKLSRHRYHPSELIPGLSKHYKNTVKFCLTVNDFGVKYVGKEHVTHLVDALKN